MSTEQNAERPVWQRCWCWQYGRCLTDCPTADVASPRPLTDENWRRAYAAVRSSVPSQPEGDAK